MTPTIKSDRSSITAVRSFRETAFYYSAVIVGALLLMLPAFYNGYPLVNPDTCSYIISGFLLDPPPSDRPVVYGLLIRFFSLNGLSLWPVVFFQAYTLSWLMFSIVKQLTGPLHYLWRTLLIITILSVGSSLSWIACELIADVYTPIAFLSLFLVLACNGNKKITTPAYILFFVSVATHLSHPLILSLPVALLFLIRRRIFNVDKLRQKSMALVVLLLLSLIPFLLAGSAVSKSKHVFLMASLLEKGVLKEYLNEHCDDEQYVLCNYKDSLSNDPMFFIWDSQSPLQKAGGREKTKDEYNLIIRRVFSEPKYTVLFIGKSLLFCYRQVLCFNIGDGNTFFNERSNVYFAVNKYLPQETTSFINSEQNQGEFFDKYDAANKFLYAIMSLSLAFFVALLLLKRKYLSKDMALLVVITIAGIVINDFDCATFSQVSGRFGCRVMWLIPFCTIILAFQKKRVKLNEPNPLT